MIEHLTAIGLVYQQKLPLQMMTSYGTSPMILAPLFKLFCIALAILALIYVISLFSNLSTNYQVNFSPFYPARMSLSGFFLRQPSYVSTYVTHHQHYTPIHTCAPRTQRVYSERSQGMLHVHGHNHVHVHGHGHGHGCS